LFSLFGLKTSWTLVQHAHILISRIMRGRAGGADAGRTRRGASTGRRLASHAAIWQ
jgi:hypothetical protein